MELSRRRQLAAAILCPAERKERAVDQSMEGGSWLAFAGLVALEIAIEDDEKELEVDLRW